MSESDNRAGAPAEGTPYYHDVSELFGSVRALLPPVAQQMYLELFNRTYAERPDVHFAHMNALRYFLRGDHGEFLVYPDRIPLEGANAQWSARCRFCDRVGDRLEGFDHAPDCLIERVGRGEADLEELLGM